jgi:hypothetical protein
LSRPLRCCALRSPGRASQTGQEILPYAARVKPKRLGMDFGLKTHDYRSGLSPANSWKAKYGGLEVSDAKPLKALEDENAKLKKLLAEAMLDNATLKDVVTKNGDARREARGRRSYAQRFEVSERRACAVLGVDRTSMRYGAIGLTMRPYAPACASWRRSAAGSGIAVCLCCCAARVWS